MNAGAVAALLAATLAAAVDWGAVAARAKRVEYVAKPATLAALVVAAAALDPAHGAQRGWFVAGLVLSLAGDVFLMLPSDRFVAGLASFLLAHLAYIAGFVAAGTSTTALLVGIAVVAPVSAVVGRRILAAVPRDLIAPVAIYMGAISVMTVLAFREPLSLVGAALFYGSDATIAWNRFVRPLRWAPLAIIVTYHLGQAALVVSLT